MGGDVRNSYIPAKWCVSAIHARGGAEGMYELIHTFCRDITIIYPVTIAICYDS